MNSDEKNKVLCEDEQCESLAEKDSKTVDGKLAEEELEDVVGGGAVFPPTRGTGSGSGKKMY